MVDLDELMRLHRAATQGPWYQLLGTYVTAKKDDIKECVCTTDGFFEKRQKGCADAEYIVEACNAIPELVERIQELELKSYGYREIMILKERIKDLEEYNYELHRQLKRYEGRTLRKLGILPYYALDAHTGHAVIKDESDGVPSDIIFKCTCGTCEKFNSHEKGCPIAQCEHAGLEIYRMQREREEFKKKLDKEADTTNE